jgi:hypothetical protein
MNAQLDELGEVQRLERQLRIQLNGRIHNFRLIERIGGVVLQGWASSFYAKQVAQHAVMEALALPIIANDIEVADAPVMDAD